MLEAEQKEAQVEFNERLTSANNLPEVYSQLAEQVDSAKEKGLSNKEKIDTVIGSLLIDFKQHQGLSGSSF